MRAFHPRQFLSVVLFCLPLAVQAQTNIRVAIDDLTDNRFAASEFDPLFGEPKGSLAIRLVLEGDGLDRIAAARIILEQARDDQGNPIDIGKLESDFRSTDVNAGRLDVSLANPSRAAASFSLSGKVELYVPSRDPGSLVRVPKAFARLDKPITARELRAAKLELTPISSKKYAEERAKQAIDEDAIAEIRAEGKKEGASDEEINAVIELMKAFQELGNIEPDENLVVLAGKPADFDRIFSIRLVRANGEEIDVSQSSKSTFKGRTTVAFKTSEAPPADAGIVVSVLTDKARISIPFSLENIPLP